MVKKIQDLEKGRASQGDQPPSKIVSKMVAQKTPDVKRKRCWRNSRHMRKMTQFAKCVR